MPRIHTDNGVAEVVLSVLASIVSVMIGDWLPIMGTLLVLNFADMLTGLIKGGTKREIGSRALSAGLAKKSGQWIMVIVANSIDDMIFDKQPIAKTGLISFLVATEGISITENLAEIGVPIPVFITKYLSQIRDVNNDKELNK